MPGLVSWRRASTERVLAQIRRQLHELGRARMILSPDEAEAVRTEPRTRHQAQEATLRQIGLHEVARQDRDPVLPVEQAAPDVADAAQVLDARERPRLRVGQRIE